MKILHKKRLLKLAAHLRTVPRARFNMSYFGGSSPGCLTNGCAAGHAADIFRRQGYDCQGFPSLLVSATAERFIGIEAVKQFFGLDDNGYTFIFSSRNAGSTPKQAAKRIEDWVKCYV